MANESGQASEHPWSDAVMPQVEIPSDIREETITAYARSRQLETWLREMIYLETKAHYGTAYWVECNAALKRANAHGIPPERSQQHDQRHPHMATAENDPLWFVSFDALLKILFDDQLWPLFEPYLTTKNILRGKMEEITIIRNRTAHCRGLHQHDLDRLLLILRELDPGIFRFVATYGDAYYFDERDAQNPVYQHFREYYAWNQAHLRTHLDIRSVFRPSASYEEAMATGKGRLYHYVIYTRHEDRAHFDYVDIFRLTRRLHPNIAHLIMDSDQRFLHVTIPSFLPAGIITATIERFYAVCANSHGTLLTHRLRDTERQENETHDAHDRRILEATNRIFDDVALEWPHYVIPPSHAYAILDSSTPCTMFVASRGSRQ